MACAITGLCPCHALCNSLRRMHCAGSACICSSSLLCILARMLASWKAPWRRACLGSNGASPSLHALPAVMRAPRPRYRVVLIMHEVGRGRCRRQGRTPASGIGNLHRGAGAEAATYAREPLLRPRPQPRYVDRSRGMRLLNRYASWEDQQVQRRQWATVVGAAPQAPLASGGPMLVEGAAAI